jgi:hypothetical protein
MENKQLEDYKELQRKVHTDIEKVWGYDTAQPLNEIQTKERIEIIERVFYTIANEWLDGDNL